MKADFMAYNMLSPAYAVSQPAIPARLLLSPQDRQCLDTANSLDTSAEDGSGAVRQCRPF